MALEAETQVEERSGKELPLLDQQGNEHPTHPAVSVEKWMDRLKLDVSQTRTNQWGKGGFLGVDPLLKVSQEFR